MPWIHELRALADDSGKQLTFVDRTGTPMEFVNLAEPNEPFTRRLAACWNACLGITTETLEAGVVVVPVDLLRSTYYLLGKIADQDALTSYDRRRATELVEELGNALSRFQQNGGEGR